MRPLDLALSKRGSRPLLHCSGSVVPWVCRVQETLGRGPRGEQLDGSVVELEAVWSGKSTAPRAAGGRGEGAWWRW